jgi:hypothetical protein
LDTVLDHQRTVKDLAMGTMTITAAGFANLPATVPANWPATIVYPANGNPNGTKVYTWTDADWVRAITWVASTQYRPPVGSLPPFTVTAAQLLLAYVQGWVDATVQSERGFSTQTIIPAPINPA